MEIIGRIQTNETVFNVTLGISEDQIDDLIRYSNEDDLVREFTGDTKRFSNRESFESWKKKGRTIYTLSSEADSPLFGILWLGNSIFPHDIEPPSSLSGEEIPTFAIRLYGEAR